MTSTYLMVLFVALPLLELMLLLRVGEIIGLGPTVALVIVTGVVGATLARIEGLRVILAIQKDMSEGRMPAVHLVDGAMILVAGAFLITPGIITDATGFLLLIPPVRAIIRKWVRGKMESRIHADYIEADYHE
ncbi:MAG: FxsA family protein [Verrucomicrobia bacterium]|nr:FxsA family protein [Verrucomicrobiota bacterium]